VASQPAFETFCGRDTQVENKMHKGTMRRVLLATIGLASAAIFSSTAMAADLSRPVYKAPAAGVIPAAYD